MKRKAPQGHRREPFLRNLLGEQKVPRRRQNARRAKKRGPQAQKEQHPEGEEKHSKKRPGPQAQREQRPEGEEKYFKKWPGPQAQKKHSQLNKTPPTWAERNVSEDTRLKTESIADTLATPLKPLARPAPTAQSCLKILCLTRRYAKPRSGLAFRFHGGLTREAGETPARSRHCNQAGESRVGVVCCATAL